MDRGGLFRKHLAQDRMKPPSELHAPQRGVLDCLQQTGHRPPSVCIPTDIGHLFRCGPELGRVIGEGGGAG